MSETRTYKVVEADYLDREEGLLIGVTVQAEPADLSNQLRVTHIGDEQLKYPIAVGVGQLELIAA